MRANSPQTKKSMRAFPQCTRHAVDKPRHKLSPPAADALQKPLVQCKVIQAQELLGACVHPAQGRKD
jgi:hypothetical protein